MSHTVKLPVSHTVKLPVSHTDTQSQLVTGFGLPRQSAARVGPEAVPAFLRECERASGADPRLDAQLARVREDLAALDSADPQWLARRLVEGMALALQGSLLVRHAPPAVADAFCARLGDGRRGVGTLPPGVNAQAIIDRALAA